MLNLLKLGRGPPSPVAWDPAVGKNGKKRSEMPQKESASEASWAVDWAGGKGGGTLSPPQTTARFTSLAD